MGVASTVDLLHFAIKKCKMTVDPSNTVIKEGMNSIHQPL